ncbi:magnesium transporter [Rhodococcus sp. 06-156-3C]|uniref:magnesium and cobalt transport protein CorA n=1 Tax=Nocardiaceae TaxID=85025 RepID=UPI000B0CBE27|nr:MULTISPECIES: magnesium and cobalt transport protein CorA [Rhodococcus]OZC80929.1 magnesium transporter [Rhodococcus sp. 06-418-1B]OZD14277.1 magnesium transporter [Rhodococcus sp. 06-156-3C]OZD15968.1 magnesium transporter [Rhodococcus sp. 06-156-4C]OZD24613.1 magnesium transporter [Rhodococcus sp. 06-156-3b]OZD28568.1 magnesium transporter [Rhodococcus sp. 06-156-4a]
MPSLPPRPSLPSLHSLRPSNRGQAAGPKVPVPTARAIVDCAVYVDGHRLPGKYTHSAAVAEVRKRGEGFVWLGLHAPDEGQMDGVAQCYGLHELMVEDAVHAHQRPKLERYDDVLFLVLRTISYVEHESVTTANEIVESGEIMVFLGRDFVITVRHGEHSGLSGVRRTLENNPEQLALGPSAVLHAVADHVVDEYLEVTGSIERDVDVMEEEVFSPHHHVPIENIYLLKREVVELRRSVTPLSTPLNQLAQSSENPVPKAVRRYLRDVQDHHTLVAERVAEFDEVLSSLVDAALARVTMQQNMDMRKISAWVAIAALPTMVAGIYGMNFDNIPELHWKYGYYIVVAVVAVACVGLFATFRKNDWL